MLFKKQLSFVPMLALVFVVYLPVAVSADSLSENAWGLGIDAGHQEQSSELSTAKLNSIILAPSYATENVDFSLSVPWYQKTGEFFLNGVRPRLITRCQRIVELTPARQNFLINHGKLTLAQVTRCTKVMDKLSELNDTYTGVGDVTGFVRYNFDLGESDLWRSSVGLGFKTDSGDDAHGLGTGTKDTLLEYSLSAASEKNIFVLTLGYDISSDGNAIADVYEPKNYGYVSADYSHNFYKWFALGLTLDAQQSYVEGASATKTATFYSDLSMGENWSLRLFANKYASDEKNIPDRDLGITLRYHF